tara:strand:- start:320 stop:1051 length:732 start_codon:yes stop_codon:yes gene_type:complete
MSGSSVQVDSTSISTMLLALMVICIVVYGYIEFKRVHSRLNAMEEFTSRIMNLLKNGPPESRSPNPPVTQDSSPGSKDDGAKEDDATEADATEADATEADAKDSLVESFVNPVEEGDVEDGIEDSELDKGKTTIQMDDPLLQVNPERIVDLGEDKQEEIEIEFNFMNKLEDEDESHEENPLIPKSQPENDIANLNDIDEPLTSVQLEEYTIRQLKDVLTSMSLPTSGNKASLIKRILTNQTTK